MDTGHRRVLAISTIKKASLAWSDRLFGFSLWWRKKPQRKTEKSGLTTRDYKKPPFNQGTRDVKCGKSAADIVAVEVQSSQLIKSV